jgi:RimJ/RimL family protein N-acetyltransferase
MTRPWLNPLPADVARRAALAAVLPRIETARLVLRAPRIEDWEVLEPIWTETRSWTPDHGTDPEEAWLDFAQIVASWMLRGYGPLTITARDGGQVLGLLAVDHEYGDPEPELGWFLTADAEGKGYATEAARAALPWLTGVFGDGGFVAYVDPTNARSDAVAERLGGRRDTAAEAALAEPVRVWRFGRRP